MSARFEPSMANSRGQNDTSRLVTTISIVGLVAVLYFAREVLIPLALAILLTFVLAPLVIWLQRLKMGRVPAVLIAAALSFLTIGVVGWIMAGQIIDLGDKLPQYEGNIRSKIAALQSSTGGIFGRAKQSIRDIGTEVLKNATQPQEASTQPQRPIAERTLQEPIAVEVKEKPTNPLEAIAAVFTPMLHPLLSAGIVIIFVIFMLIQREDLRDRLIRLIGEEQLTTTTQAIDDAANRVSRYLRVLLIVNSTYGLAVAVGLSFIGIPNAILWGMFAGLLRFIPYIGPWIGASVPIVLSLAVFHGWKIPVMTVSLFVVLEILTANFIEPYLYGSRTGVSALAVLVSAVFWGWLWGGAGLMLSTPLTVCLVVIGRYVPQFGFLNVLFGDEPSLPPDARVYQRLLAMDQDAVFLLADEFLKEKSLEDFYDQVLIPALIRAQRDRHHRVLEEGRELFIYQAVHDLVENLGERMRQAAIALVLSDSGSTKEPKEPVLGPPAPPTMGSPSVLCVPAREQPDEIVAIMLAQLLEAAGAAAQALPAAMLASEMLDQVKERRPDFVCISAMPPLAVMHSRYMCKRLATDIPELKVVVGLW